MKPHLSFRRLLIVLIALVVVIPLLFLVANRADISVWMTYYLALVTGGVIWWQGTMLKRQLELQTIVELYKEWDSERMIAVRKNYFIKKDDLNAVEELLEFIEKVASYYMREVLTDQLVWDTFQWYITRYYFYSQDKIPQIEEKWKYKRLYKDLETTYNDLLKLEMLEREMTWEKLQEELISRKETFRSSELGE